MKRNNNNINKKQQITRDSKIKEGDEFEMKDI